MKRALLLSLIALCSITIHAQEFKYCGQVESISVSTHGKKWFVMKDFKSSFDNSITTDELILVTTAKVNNHDVCVTYTISDHSSKGYSERVLTIK